MIKIFLLVITFSNFVPCPNNSYISYARPIGTVGECKAPNPFVSFYFSKDTAILERDSLLGKGDAARMFEIDIITTRWWNPEGVNPVSDSEPQSSHKRISVHELKTEPVQTYRVTESTITVTE